MKFNKNLENIKTYEAGKPIELVVREFGIDPKDIVLCHCKGRCHIFDQCPIFKSIKENIKGENNE